MASAAVALQPQRRTFPDFASWVAWMNTNVQQRNWFIVGGCAAWLQIEEYSNKDPDYYKGIRSSILPGDIEVGVLAEKAEELKKLYAELLVKIDGQEVKVDVQPVDASTLETQLTRCETVSDACIYTPGSLISRYLTASDASKEKKRQTRVAMLKLIEAKKRIDQPGALSLPAQVSFAKQLAGVKLKKTLDESKKDP